MRFADGCQASAHRRRSESVVGHGGEIAGDDFRTGGQSGKVPPGAEISEVKEVGAVGPFRVFRLRLAGVSSNGIAERDVHDRRACPWNGDRVQLHWQLRKAIDPDGEGQLLVSVRLLPLTYGPGGENMDSDPSFPIPDRHFR